ncbi:NAD(P)H-dependent oxidoreductase [Streptomyces sp. NPDC050636]|uniref:NADPH-dependent FMN reductase n=1 Tax=Streptomyces sp. NPDC050636 TaxID=3154510 RepID=UPI00341FDD6A
MPGTRIRLAVLTCSGPAARSGPLAAQWLLDEADKYGQFDVEVVDLTAAQLPVVITRPPGAEAVERLAAVSPALAAADAFIVVTPEYNHGYPAVLKSAIDWHTTEWHAKPVGFVSYGGRSGGLRAVEQLRLVFAELHAVTLRDGIGFAQVWDQFDEAGAPKDPAGCAGAAKVMFDQLTWWALALGEARDKRPYTG